MPIDRHTRLKGLGKMTFEKVGIQGVFFLNTEGLIRPTNSTITK